MTTDTPDSTPLPSSVVERYEELRGAVLGQRAAFRWGLNVLHQRGLAAWSRAVPAPNKLAPGTLQPEGLPTMHQGNLLPDHQLLIPLIARMVAASFQDEVAR